jgi:bacteriocin-like protein
MTIMTSIQATKVLSDAELNAVVGGFTVPKAIQAEEIYKVEHERMPPGVRSRLIREIEAGQILI